MEMQTLREQARRLGVAVEGIPDSRIRLIRSIQRARRQPPCCATDERYGCRQPCQWKADCNGLVAAWLR